MKQTIEGRIIDHHNRETFEGSIRIENGKITGIKRHKTESTSYIMAGFVDSHIHIESSMLTPEEFGRTAIKRGTVAVVADPHEIANVMGREGIEYMIQSSQYSPIKTFFSIPSSVPATPFDVTGGEISAADIEELAKSGKFVALSEMMNVPGVINDDTDITSKINSAKRYNLPIDGHAPALSGEQLQCYINHGITTDHESFTLEEAQEKLNCGMKIHIREGSAARNFNALHPLIATSPNDVMFCTDDSHPESLIDIGHIDKHVRRALDKGYNIYDILTIASSNAIKHYNLKVGELKVGDSADFIVVDNLNNFNIESVFINGEQRYNAEPEIVYSPSPLKSINCFNHDRIGEKELSYPTTDSSIKVIQLHDGELITTELDYTPTASDNNFESDIENDILKLVYINRYTNGTPQVAFCRGFGFKHGAIASSIAHDSHNIIAVGCSDKDLCAAINNIIEHKGGLSVHTSNRSNILPLPIAGIMSDKPATEVAKQYMSLCQMSRDMGGKVESPFMTLSFLSLVVIPEIKIGEKGLFSYSLFDWVK